MVMRRLFVLTSRPAKVVIGAAVIASVVVMIFFQQQGWLKWRQSNEPQAVQTQEQLTEVLGNLCSSRNVVGVGLYGEYFSQPKAQGRLLLSRVDQSIEFPSGFDLPAESGSTAPASIRWRGWVKTPTTGEYRFHIEPATARVTVANQLVAGPGAAADVSVQGFGGRHMPIQIEIDRLGAGVNSVKLEWTAPHGARFVIPKVLLNLPTDMVTSPAISSKS